MPTYEYRCENCGNKFEKFQSISAPSLRRCPACGKMTLKRLIGTGAGIIFKGSGFYETDYRSDAYKQAAKKETDSKSPKAESKIKSKSKKNKPQKTSDSTGKKSHSSNSNKKSA